MSAPEFEPRDGDVLVVSYPEANVGLGGNSYSSVKVGGLIYTRKLVEGDDPEEQYRKIYAYLERLALRDGRAKIALFMEELRKIRGGS